jgi:hypothetical protein
MKEQLPQIVPVNRADIFTGSVFERIWPDWTLDVATYTVDIKMTHLFHVRKLIYAVCPDTPIAEQRFWVPNNHAKIILCYTIDKKLITGFAGSQNFVRPTLHEFFVELNRNQLREAHVFFDLLWNRRIV